MNIDHELSRNWAHDRGYNEMVGNTEEMTSLKQSHDETTLYVPLRFFFNRNNGLALPLIALPYHEVRVKLTLNDLSSLVCRSANVSESDLKNNIKIQSLDLMCEYVFLDNVERERFAKNSHEYLIEQVQFTGEESVTQTSVNTKLNFNHPVKELIWCLKLGKYTTDSDTTYLAYNPHNSDDTALRATRRFVLRCCQYSDATCTSLVADANNKLVAVTGLPSAVQAVFDAVDARYMVQSSTDVDNVAIYGRLLSSKEVSTVVSSLLSGADLSVVEDATPPTWFGIDNVGNVSDDQDGHSSNDVVVKQQDNYALNMDKSGNPVLNGKLQLNGTDRFDEQSGNYFNYVQPWQHHTNTPSDGVNCYSFALNPEEHQPSSTCNFSRIDSTVLKLKFNTEVSSGNNRLFVFAKNYNVFRVTGGMGGIVYAS